MKKIPEKVYKDFRMEILALKNKLLELESKYELDFIEETINYLQEVQYLNKEGK
jgi:hypothetical protein